MKIVHFALLCLFSAEALALNCSYTSERTTRASRAAERLATLGHPDSFEIDSIAIDTVVRHAGKLFLVTPRMNPSQLTLTRIRPLSPAVKVDCSQAFVAEGDGMLLVDTCFKKTAAETYERIENLGQDLSIAQNLSLAQTSFESRDITVNGDASPVTVFPYELFKVESAIRVYTCQ